MEMRRIAEKGGSPVFRKRREEKCKAGSFICGLFCDQGGGSGGNVDGLNVGGRVREGAN